jgi:AraC-like DNA-binding protein
MKPAYRDSVHRVVLSGLTRYLERSGYSINAFRRLSGVGAEESNDPDARVPIETMVRRWKAALELTENPALGLAVGADYSSISHGILGHLISHSDTLGDALKVLCRYQRLLSGGDFLELVEDRSEASLTYHADDPDPDLWPTVVERAFASVVTVATGEAMGRFTLKAVEFDYPKPRHSSAYSALFAAPCRFGAPKSRLIFPRSHMGLRMRNRHSSLHAVLSREVEATHPGLIEDKRGTRARLWKTLPNLLDRGAISAEEASNALGVSERTLHRRLSLEGATYSELLDKARFERSIRLMGAPDASIEEIAMACGFQDNSGFYRALKRWTGMTPRAFRRSLWTKRKEGTDSLAVQSWLFNWDGNPRTVGRMKLRPRRRFGIAEQSK